MRKTMKKEIQAKFCIRCGGELGPRASFCHLCGERVLERSKRASPRRAGRGACLGIVGGILVAVIVISGAFGALVHSSSQGSLYHSPTQSDWQVPSSSGGRSESVVVPAREPTVVPTNIADDTRTLSRVSLYTNGEITSVQIPSTIEEGQTAAASVTVKNTGNTGATFDVRLGTEASEQIYLDADNSGTISFDLIAERGQRDITFSLYVNGIPYDTKTRSVTVVYPVLHLALNMIGNDWIRDENDLPLAIVTFKYTVTNRGTAPARDVSLTLRDREGDRSWKISYLGVGQNYQGTVKVKTSQVWEEKGGFHFLAKFAVRVELVARYNGNETKQSFSSDLPRAWPSKFYITPNDPVVKETLNRLFKEKAWWDPRLREVYIADWVGGGITGFGLGDCVTYGKPGEEGINMLDVALAQITEKLDELSKKWITTYGFWNQLPRETIMSRKGVCIDQAILYATFMRAYGYKPGDVYVVVGEEVRHAWVALNRPIFGWTLVETTAGGAMRVANNILVKPFAQAWDAIVNALGHEEMQTYRESYMFNDIFFREVRGDWRF